MKPSPQPRRRWLRFSLRTLLVVMLLLGCSLGWIGMQLQQARRHVAAVKEIEELEGTVGLPVWIDYREEHLGFTGIRLIPIQGLKLIPLWKQRLYGVYAVENHDVDLNGTDATDSTLALIKGMKCEQLGLESTTITDAGLAQIQGMTSLEYLSLSGTQISDEGLNHLEGMANLKWLDLNGTQVTDAGLKHLQGLNDLRWLTMKSTSVTEQGVDRLQKAIPDCEIYYSPIEMAPGSAPP